jgi:ANTAR domain
MSTSDGVTDASARNDQQRITDAVQAIIDRRAVIEQAKGMLMFVYGIDADQAFDELRLQSQQQNVKLRLVAEQILKDLVELSRTKSPQRQLAFGGLLTVAHQRIAHGAVRQLDGQSKTGVPMRELGSTTGQGAGS